MLTAVKFVTGRSTFAGDTTPRGMLYARILTCPHAHATIRDIDVSQAKALPGVHAVLTYKDVPRVPYSSVDRLHSTRGPRDQYCLDNHMRYVGDRVAVVAAETPEEAEQALSLIQVDYEVLPAIFDPRQALESHAPCIHPESGSHGIYDAARNIVTRVHTEVGGVEHGLAVSDLVIENEYIVPVVQQTPIENHTVITYFDEDNYLVVQTSTHAPHHIRRTLAEILNIPARRIRVVQSCVGGDFGVKQAVVLEDICALLTVVTNQPVMLAYSRREGFSSRWNQEHIVRLKTGVNRDGTIVANQMLLLASTGAYSTHSLIDQSHIAANVLALYACPNMQFVAEVLYTNTPPSSALRGYAMPESFFALECHMDEIALQLGMDALQLRRKNWIKAGDEYPFARNLEKSKDIVPRIESCGLSECLQIVEEKLSWGEKRSQAGDGRFRRGVGVALSLYGNPRINTKSEAEISGVIIKLNDDGSFDVFVDANDSSGGSTTMLAQMLAEILGVPLEDVLIHTSETSITPLSTSMNTSTTFYVGGEAVKKAAEQVRRQVLTVAGRMLNALPEALKIHARTITAPSGQSITIAQVADHALYTENRYIMTSASAKILHTPTSFAAQGVEVEVDTETGSIHVLKAITAVDAGQVINPLLVEGQIQGSATQALGVGVCEELIYNEKGVLLTTNFRDYHIYNALDMPEIQTYIVETRDPSGPFGAKAVVEIALNGMAPALVNAVTNALGVRLRQIPLTPERVLRALYAQKAK